VKNIKLSINRNSSYYIILAGLILLNTYCDDSSLRTWQYGSTNIEDANQWQSELRIKLAKLLKMEDQIYSDNNPSFDETVISTKNHDSYIQKIIEINSTSKRRIEIVLTAPIIMNEKLPAVVCIAGHGGNKFSVYEEGEFISMIF
jgi:hypothetical protein